MARAANRIKREMEKFNSEPPEGFRLEVQSDNIWLMHVTGPSGTLYAGENYTLKIRFTDDYPMDSPEVVFIPPSPVHPHIYSNGHICLNILGDDWSPALTVQSVCISIVSMLASATEKTRPPDDDRYSRSKPAGANAKATKFMYHDDSV